MVESNMLTILLLAFAYLKLWITTIPIAIASDSLIPGDQVNSSTTLCSANEKHCMVFREMPEESGQRYLVIYENTEACRVVWFGNRNQPIFDNDGVLILDNSGVLKIVNQGGNSTINLYSPAQATNNTKAILFDSGNFVLQELYPDGSVKSVVWQSFDHPSGTLLPEMKLGVNHILVSYMTDEYPASASFTLEWESTSGQLIMQRSGQTYWASGMLINNKFEHIPEAAQSIYQYAKDEEYFSFTAINDDYAKWRLYGSGQLIDSRGNYIARADECYGYNTDGGCQKWNLPTCRHKGEVFEVRSGSMRNFDLPYLMFNGSTSLSVADCKAICWNNCSCFGFANYYANGTGCVFYNGNPWVNIPDPGDDIYFMLVSTSSEKHGTNIWIWIGAVIVIALFNAM